MVDFDNPLWLLLDFENHHDLLKFKVHPPHSQFLNVLVYPIHNESTGYCLIQSKSIINIWLTIQIQFSKWIDNPIQIQLFLEKDIEQQILNSSFVMKPWNSQETFLIKFQPYCQINCLKILMKSSLASLLEHDALWNFILLIK